MAPAKKKFFWDSRLSVRETANAGNGIFANSTIKPKERVFLCRRSEMLTSLSAFKDSRFGKICKDPRVTNRKHWFILSLYLLAEASYPESVWQEFIATLPVEKPDVPWTWEDEEIKNLLSGSPTMEHARRRRQKLEQLYNDVIIPVCADHPDVLPQMSLDRFLWAVSCIRTRSFVFDIEEGDPEAVPGATTYWAMVPSIDFMNHDGRKLTNCACTIHSNGSLELTAKKSIKKDMQLTFSYGHLDCFTLFTRYGFLLPRDEGWTQIRWENRITTDDVPLKERCDEFFRAKVPTCPHLVRYGAATRKGSKAGLDPGLMALYRIYALSLQGDSFLPGSVSASATSFLQGSVEELDDEPVDEQNAVVDNTTDDDAESDIDDDISEYDYDSGDDICTVAQGIATKFTAVAISNEIQALKLLETNVNRLLAGYEASPPAPTTAHGFAARDMKKREEMVLSMLQKRFSSRRELLERRVEQHYGSNCNSKKYESVAQFFDEMKKSGKWYVAAVDYWDHQPPTVDGVLGGFGHTDALDCQGSLDALKPFSEVWKGKSGTVGLECGAGIGRVSKGVLLHVVDKVEIMEPCAHLLKKARENLDPNRVLAFHQNSLQTFPFPTTPTYHLIVVQWCSLYLTDDDFIEVFQKCQRSLQPDGVILMKDNISRNGFMVDVEDTSIGRTHNHNKTLFKKAGLTLLCDKRQPNWPKELFPVHMYILR